MSNIVDNILASVCLDERVSDGVFKLDEEQHMNALRDYLIKKGIPMDEAIGITNRMLEGRFPERQAYNKDGILVTFPTPQHKARAISRGTHFEKNPRPQPPPREPAPEKEVPPAPKEPSPEKPEGRKSPPKTEEPPEEKAPTIFQGDKKLEIEPPRGDKKPEPTPSVGLAMPHPSPKTPERIAAEKEVVKQIIKTDDTVLSNVASPLSLNETCKYQLKELYKKADELGYREAVTFLTPYVKP